MVFSEKDKISIQFLRQNKQCGAEKFLKELPHKMPERTVYRTEVGDIEDLRQRIMQVWDEFDQGIIDASTKQWRARLRACVAANGGQFEQLSFHEFPLWVEYHYNYLGYAYYNFDEY